MVRGPALARDQTLGGGLLAPDGCPLLPTGSPRQKGTVMGTLRSLGALARAVGPVVAASGEAAIRPSGHAGGPASRWGGCWPSRRGQVGPGHRRLPRCLHSVLAGRRPRLLHRERRALPAPVLRPADPEPPSADTQGRVAGPPLAVCEGGGLRGKGGPGPGQLPLPA